MVELREGSCYPKAVVAVNAALACVEGFIAVFAFFQLMRIHSRSSHAGWTRQKVFHVMIGSSNAGYFLYFVLTLVAACKGWSCWSQSCGFIVMAFPKIPFLAAFLLLLSFWVDLCHQPNDEDDEEEGCSPQQALLEKTNKPNSSANKHRKCCSFRGSHIGSRQKIVVLVTMLMFVLMIISAVLIWIGVGRGPVDSSVVARVYVDLLAVAVLLLGGALACYGLLLSLRMSNVRSERATETWKVRGLAVVSVLCFTSSAFVGLFTDIPVLYHWHAQHINEVYTSLLLVLYYFIGSSVPSAFVLWVMRELPPATVVNLLEESRTITFISGSPETMIHPQRWTAVTSSQNQVSRASPI